MRLYETHLPVLDVGASIAFYEEVVGWSLGIHIEERNCAFLLSPGEPETMLGLWGPGSLHHEPYRKMHLAFWVELDELIRLHGSLPERGIPVKGFRGETDEPSVIGWMPTAQFYFQDPDGHSLEFIARVPGRPNPDILNTLSEWLSTAQEDVKPV